jgi:tyrosyl-tRNA synthetase
MLSVPFLLRYRAVVDALLTRAVEQVVPLDLAEKLFASKKHLRVYLGIDPTGSKLHLGHSVPLRKLQAFADAGHEVIFIVGSFTAMIGDPSGRDAQRVPLTKDQVEENFQTYKKQAGKVLDFSKVTIRYNHEWLSKVTYEHVVEHASHFTVQQMEKRDMFAERLKKDIPISVHEFLYPLMVGYDSVVLDVDCEIGGSDQLFNMLCGRTLQKAYGKREKFVLTTKLIEGTDGRKMSKTFDNCIWIDDTSEEMYGKILSIHDGLIATYMECCTDIPMGEIADAVEAMKGGSNPKAFKMRLAKEIVTIYHGAKAAAKAEEEFSKVFTCHGTPSAIQEVKVKRGTKLVDVLVEHHLVASKSEARRLIEQKGISIDGTTVATFDVAAGAGIVKVGKRKFLKIL